MTEKEIQQFRTYLIDQYKESTIDETIRNVERFEHWCDIKHIHDMGYVTKSDILEYAKYMSAIPVTVGTQNIRIQSLYKYYQFLISQGLATKNPARGIVIKGKKKKVVAHPFDDNDLLNLFKSYQDYLKSKPQLPNIPKQQRTDTDNRRLALLSLVIFQGLHTGELSKLFIEHIDLDNGTIYIPSTGRSNPRTIQLHQSQILLLNNYLNSLPDHQDKLFAHDTNNTFHHILQELKGINGVLRNLQHIRGSVIINWIKKYGVRRAQYMIGHRYVSTTESYEVQDTSELSDLMVTAHPFGKAS